jgi:phosphohistidine swiveling domain-containing protein
MSFIVNFDFGRGLADPSLLGGKGASLKKMAALGLPVPPGFTLTTKTWRLFDQEGKLPQKISKEVFVFIEALEKKTGKSFGGEKNPLLVSVRSGAKYSMPGMMDTILNVGISEDVLPGLAESLGGRVYAWDTYRRFIKMFASTTYGIHEGEFDLVCEAMGVAPGRFTLKQLKQLVRLFEKLVFEKTGHKIPYDPRAQLLQAITAVFDSWYNPGAVAFRQINGIPDEVGTAVNVQAMVFGNRQNSGTGVLFTRDTQLGKDLFTGDFMKKAQGEEVVRGASLRRTLTMAAFSHEYPRLAKELFGYAKSLERLYKDVQDIEFTVEDGKVWLLQTRSARRSPLANIRFARDLLAEGIISEKEAFRRVKPGDIKHVMLPGFEKKEEERAQAESLFARGIPASAGAAVGALVLSPEEARKLVDEGKRVILVGDHIDPNDVDTLMMVEGVATIKGSASSHMAIIMRSSGKPGVVGCSGMKIVNKGKFLSNGKKKLAEGSKASLNATSGLLYEGVLKRKARGIVPEDVLAFVKKRNKRLTESSWSAALYDEAGAPRLPALLGQVRKIYDSAAKNWRSQKARVIKLVNAVFPGKEIIRSNLVRPSNVVALRKALLGVIDQGFFNAPRTCHHPEKLAGAPWANGPNTKRAIDKFLKNPRYPGKYGGYPSWVKDETLDAIVVSSEPEGKLDPTLTSQHFVCTISALYSYPPQIVVSVNFGAAHLRSLERIESTNLALIRATLNSRADYEVGSITYQVGEEYFDNNQIKKLLRAIQAGSWSKKSSFEAKIIRPSRHLAKQILVFRPKVKLESLTLASLREILKELMEHNTLPADVYQYVINSQTLSLLDQISKKIFEDWWRPPMALPYLMTALDEVIGLSVVEAQGRFGGDKLAWFKIYGAKGAEEKEKIASWKSGSGN